jgi:hypothetical protein
MSVRLEWAVAGEVGCYLHRRGDELGDGNVVSGEAALAIHGLIVEGSLEDLERLLAEGLRLVTAAQTFDGQEPRPSIEPRVGAHTFAVAAPFPPEEDVWRIAGRYNVAAQYRRDDAGELGWLTLHGDALPVLQACALAIGKAAA